VRALLAPMSDRVLYESSNGDVWSLARHPASSTPVVKHQPNAGSGGRTSYIEIGRFLRGSANGPEHQALLNLIGTLIPD
jgi:hypothetical protein